MKTKGISAISPVSLLILLLLICCEKSEIGYYKCHEGVVIGKIRSWGGGVAMSVDDSNISAHQWKGFERVVEALNVPDSLWKPGKKVYMFVRPATEKEKVFAISSDGDESDKPIVFIVSISGAACPPDDKK